jgi:Ca2+-binding EF-hand superfamily protein
MDLLVVNNVMNTNILIGEENAFTEDEIQSLKDIFDLFDRDKSGRIQLRDLEAIMQSLKRDTNEAREMLKLVEPSQDDTVTFEEFI